MFLLKHFCWLTLLVSTAASANSDVFDIETSLSLLPESSDASLLVVDAKTQQTLFSQNAEQLRPPASVQKLITALAAKLFLPDDYQFSTDLEVSGDDIILRFSGDPTLTRDHIRRLLGKLKTQHGAIKGNLYLNGGAFDKFDLASGLPWDNLGVCYSAPASSITLDKNCVSSKFYFTDDSHTQTSFLLPKQAPVEVVSEVNIPSAAKTPSYCEFKLLADHNNQYTLGGCLPEFKMPMYLNFAVQNTSLYAKELVKQELDYAGIDLHGAIIRNDTVSGKIIARHESEQLKQLIAIMLKDSDNLIADNLLKTIGRYFYSEAGSYENGVAAVKTILKDVADIDLNNAMLSDGSGLSRNNRLTASQILQVLLYISNHPELELDKAMAVSGVDGTLQYRYSVRNAPLKGRIQAKSGSLYGTYNLAGIMHTYSGRHIVFVQMVTNYHQDKEKQPKQAIRRFEKSLYQSLFDTH